MQVASLPADAPEVPLAATIVVAMAAMAVIDHFGRKRLMRIGSMGYIVSSGLAPFAFFTNGDILRGWGP